MSQNITDNYAVTETQQNRILFAIKFYSLLKNVAHSLLIDVNKKTAKFHEDSTKNYGEDNRD